MEGLLTREGLPFFTQPFPVSVEPEAMIAGVTRQPVRLKCHEAGGLRSDYCTIFSFSFLRFSFWLFSSLPLPCHLLLADKKIRFYSLTKTTWSNTNWHYERAPTKIVRKSISFFHIFYRPKVRSFLIEFFIGMIRFATRRESSSAQKTVTSTLKQ